MTDPSKEFTEAMDKLGAEAMATEVTNRFAKMIKDEAEWLKDHYEHIGAAELKLPKMEAVFKAYSGFLEASTTSLTKLHKIYGGELVKKGTRKEKADYIMSSLERIMDIVEEDMDEEDEQTVEEIPEEMDEMKVCRVAAEVFDDGRNPDREWMKKHYELTDKELDAVLEILGEKE